MIAARASKPSRGMTVVAVLVCLIILTLISGAVLKVSVAQRELARSQERRLQAEWLAESGAERAVARLARDRDYAGETWSLERPRPGPERAGADGHIARRGRYTGGPDHDRGRARAGRRESTARSYSG